MDIIKKFTLKNLKLNKKRTIVTIIGVMLSTALICAVAGMVTSTKKTMGNVYKGEDGDFYECFQNVPNSQVKYVKNNINVDSYFYSDTLGYAKLESSQNKNKPYAYVLEFSKEALENTGLKLVAGRMPENSNELLIPNHVINNGRIDYKIGDEITLNIGTRQLADGTTLMQNTEYPIFSKTTGNEIEEEIKNTSAKTYKIVGITERPSYVLEDYDNSGYTFVTYNSNAESSQNVNIYVKYKKAKDAEKVTNDIKKVIKSNTGLDINTKENSYLLRIDGNISDDSISALYKIAGVIIGIIVISSVFVIRNSFSISVSEKNKQYGMLSSVGATRKQIKKSVLLEGLIIGIIGILLGVLLGILAVVILLQIVNYLLADMMNGYKFVYSIPMLAIILSIGVSAISIYLSCIIPAIKASRISPIDAIRGSGDVKIKAKKLKTSKLTKKLFGIGGVIARKNLKRSRKKYRTTVISIVVSITIFVSLSSFITYSKKEMGTLYKDLSYNINIDGGDADLYKKIASNEGVEDFSYTYTKTITIDEDKYGTDSYKNIYYKETKNSLKEQSNVVIMLNNDYLKKYLKTIGITDFDYNNSIIIADEMYQLDGKQKKLEYVYNIKNGDSIEIKINGVKRDVRAFKITNSELPMGYEDGFAIGGLIFASEDFIKDKKLLEDNINMSEDYNELYDKYVKVGSLFIRAKDPDQLEKQLIDLKNTDSSYARISIYNLKKTAIQMKRMILLISIFLYGFIAVITLIGVTNIFNTITTNMILRSKEFAMLKSIGMTSKEFNKMIRLESIMYGLKSLIIGIPIGICGSYLLYKAFSDSIDFGYVLPWKAILLSIVFVFLIVGLTMKYSLKKINKQNIIETIREENI